MTNPDRPPSPVPLGYETPSAYDRPAARPPRPSAPPVPFVRPGRMFGLTVAGLFVLLAMAVVAIVEIVGR